MDIKQKDGNLEYKIIKGVKIMGGYIKIDTLRRRERLVEILENNEEPLTATALGLEFGVSRQTVVNDISVLRASRVPIMSSRWGYYVSNEEGGMLKRTLPIICEEMNAYNVFRSILGYGGRVLGGKIYHPYHDIIRADFSVKDSQELMVYQQKIANGEHQSMLSLSAGYGWVDFEVRTREVYQLITSELRDHGYLWEDEYQRMTHLRKVDSGA
jgi:transcriptional regulator of NAD metabolism